jgi:glyoxylase-like metal-dependent hydrolase (beta-lactamase superfamily II)
MSFLKKKVIEFVPQHWMIQHPILAHTFFWENPDGTLSIFDAGTSLRDAEKVIAIIRTLGYSLNIVKDIIISHCHFDHIGGLPFFKKMIPQLNVISHKIEVHFLNSPYSLDSRHLKGISRWFFIPFFKRYDSRPIFVDQPVLSKTIHRFFNFIHMPGHTLGSMALHIKNSGIILTGDALYTGRNGHISYSPPIYSIDPALEKLSVKKLVECDLDYDIMVSSHGKVIDKAKKRLEQFITGSNS